MCASVYSARVSTLKIQYFTGTAPLALTPGLTNSWHARDSDVTAVAAPLAARVTMGPALQLAQTASVSQSGSLARIQGRPSQKNRETD